MYKIGDFSKKTGLSIKTLRYYDEIDLFKPSYTDFYSGYRYYTDEQLDDIYIVIELKDLGLSLSDIKSYLETRDINLLINMKSELKMQIEKIDKFNKEDNSNYTIKAGNYDDFIKMNGLKLEDTPLGQEIKSNNAKYYVIEKNGKFYDDFSIYLNENWITLYRREYKNKKLINAIKDYLKNEYQFLTEIFPVEEKEYLDFAKESFDVISEEYFYQANYCYIKIKVSLK